MTQPMNDPSYVLGQILAVLHAEGILAQLDLHTSQDILHLACEAPAQVLLPALQLREKNPGLRSFHEIELPSLGPEVLAASCNSQRFVQGFLNEELALILWCYYGCLAPHRLEDTETFCQAIADRRTP